MSPALKGFLLAPSLLLSAFNYHRFRLLENALPNAFNFPSSSVA